MMQKNQSVNIRALLIPAVFALVVIAASSLPAQQGDELKPISTTQPASTETPASTPPPTANLSGDPEPRREPDPTAILRELTSQQNAAARRVIPVNHPNQIRSTVLAPDAIPANAVKPVSTRLLPDGYRLVDRTGRLTREGDYYVFAFESRSETEAEAPMRLLPNRLLEDMEDFSEGGSRPVVFIVSGEVTEYHGVNYLLLQKLLTRPNLGNLK